MPKILFLIPIGSSIPGQLIPQMLSLKAWCERNDADIITVVGKPHNFARNYLATAGKGFVDPGPPQGVEWLVWLDSDILFTIEQLEMLLSIEHHFVAGWYVSDLSKSVMAGRWDLEYFRKHKEMPFLNKDDLQEQAKKNPHKLIEVDFTGFGFVKMHATLLKKMQYPYFTLNEQTIDNFTDLSAEDVSFCQNCLKQTGIKPVVCPALHVGHLKPIFLY